jgi:hypothetical protein
MPGPETRAVALGEVNPHVYLLLAIALLPQNVRSSRLTVAGT